MRREEFKIPDSDGNLAETFFNPEREGWLTKEGGKYKSKHKRWFILKEGMLYYFKQPTVSCVNMLICCCRRMLNKDNGYARKSGTEFYLSQYAGKSGT